MQIHQLLPSLNYGDAIGNHAIEIQRILRSWGYESDIYAHGCDERFSHLCHDYREHGKRASKDNVLIYHHCIGGTSVFPYYMSVPDRKVLIYHNITPEHFFADFHEQLAKDTRRGREELVQLRRVVSKAIGVSEYNCDELRQVGFEDVVVLPISIDTEKFKDTLPNRNVMEFFDDGYENILFVGRVSPNKRQDQLVRAFHRYRSRYNHRARLFIVGSYNGMENYCNYVLHTMQDLGARNVVLTGHTSFDELVAYYRLADAFVCLSEHEGFGVPLLESMYFEVPIIALDSTGVTPTLGGTGKLLDDSTEDRVADAIHEVLSDATLRNEIVAGQSRRLEDFHKDKTIPILHKSLEEVIESA